MENTTHIAHVKKIEFKPSFKAAWEIIKKNWKVLLVAVLFSILVQIPFMILESIWGTRMGDGFENMGGMQSAQEVFFYGVFRILSTIVSLVVSYNLFKIYLKVSHGHKFEAKEVFNFPTKNTVNYVVTQLLFFILVFVGFILLIVPGVYFCLKYMFATTLVADKDMGVLDAFNKSAEMTDGEKWTLLGIGFTSILVCIGIILLGLLCLIIGVIPAAFIATWIVIFIQLDIYKKLSH